MKVLLIYPPETHMIKTNVPTFVEQEKGFYPPLGLLYVAAYAKEHTDHQIGVLDTHLEQMDFKGLEEEVKKRKPDVVGIQTMTFTLIDVIETARAVKRAGKDIHINLGGPHVNIYPEESIQIPEVDSLTLGEGEVVFTDLISALAAGDDLGKISGLVFKKDGEIVDTGTRDFIEDLDALPFPARELTLYQKYYSILAKRSPITTMISSRGCPYRCLFCDRPHLGKKFRSRSAKNVVDEMEECVKIGISELFFYDDTFTFDRQRTLDICEEILKRGLEIGWDVRTRIDRVDEKMLEMLKKAGCERIHYGVEAGTSEILKVLRKDIKLDRAIEIFKKTRQIGITTLAYFMIGSPTETREQILETFEFAKRLNPDYLHLSVTTPFPATALYRLGLEQGVLKEDYWKKFAVDPRPDFVPELWEEKLNRDELIELLDRGYRDFYLRPSYIIKGLTQVRSVEEFKKKTLAGIKLLVSKSSSKGGQNQKSLE